MEHCLIDDFGPLPTRAPTSLDELRECVKRVQGPHSVEALYPLGGRTQWMRGLPPTRPGKALDLTALTEVIDYPARDMTITVQAGITMARLQEVLARENQRLPVDVPRAEQATLGGSLAANVSGPRRHGSGTFRDYVIGLGWINDAGEEVKAGGRVVKNVAGYDLCKLHIGALGTLGILTQVTLKLRPCPEMQAMVTFGCTSDKLADLLDTLHASRTVPSCVDVLNAHAAQQLASSRLMPAGGRLPSAKWVVVVGFEDNEASVRWQMGQLIQEISPLGIEELDAQAGLVSSAARVFSSVTTQLPESEQKSARGEGEAQRRSGCERNESLSVVDSLWSALIESTYPRHAPDQGITFKANVLPGKLATFCQFAETQGPVWLHAHAGSGIVYGHLGPSSGGSSLPEGSNHTSSPLEWKLEGVQRLLQALLQQSLSCGGNLVVISCPPAWKPQLPVWGSPRGDIGLMRRVKQQLDPNNLFNPGRFLVWG